MALAEVADKVFHTAIVDMNNKRFVRCKFTNCTLRYAGDQCEWDANTSFVQCVWEFKDAAQRTVAIFMLGLPTGDFSLRGIDFSAGN